MAALVNIRRNGRCFAVACVLLAAATLPACAQQTPAPSAPQQAPASASFKCPHPADPHRRPRACNNEDFLMDETLAGGWDHVRQVLKRIGITPTASYVGAIQTNVEGGTDQVWSYAGQFSFGASADLEELIDVPGLSAYVGISWGTGSNLSASLDSTIPSSGLYAPSFYLGEMYLQEKLHRDKLNLLAGRLAAGNGFASLPVFSNYVSYGINPNPYSLPANDATFAGPPPGAEWGAQVSYEVSRSIQIETGVFNTNVNSANGANHGADFALQEGNKGALLISELDYLRNQSDKAIGKPGQITAGFLHNNNSFTALNSPLVRSGGYNGVYLMAQQMVYRPHGPGTGQGATVWGTWTFNSKDLVSPIPQFWGAGVSDQGLIPARKNDVVSLGVVRAEGSKYGPPSNTEGQLELNYQWVHSRYLTITPHGQYSWQDRDHLGRSATVLGVQVGLTL